MQPNRRLKQERQRRGWSQERLAEAIGTSRISVARWERGVSVPYPHFREQLCTLFGKDAYELGLLPPAQPAPPSTPPLLEPLPAPIYDPALPLPPAHRKGLVGRDPLVRQLKEQLCVGESLGLSALDGLPGVGKTALALALAYDPEVRAHFGDGILWAGLGPTPNPLRVLTRWAALLGVETPVRQPDGRSEAEALAWSLRHVIGTGRFLLVLDDVWDIEAALRCQVGGPHCAYLLTTRLPQLALSFAGENAIVVPELGEEEGVALLAQFAPQLVEEEPQTARRLVHDVGGLPLALTLLGKYLQVHSSSGQPRRLQAAVAYVQTVGNRLRLSAPVAPVERPPGLPAPTSWSLQAAIAVSEQRLGEQERKALRALAVFPAKPQSFSEEAALSVAQVPVEVLDALSDAGLLESSGPGRYTLHQTNADYAYVQLTGTEAQERLIAYGVGYAEEHRTDYERLEQESSTILAALEAAYELGQQAALVRGVCAFASFLYSRGLYRLAETQLQRAYTAATALADTAGLARVLLHLGEVVERLGNYTQAQAYLREGLALARRIGDHAQVSALLWKLGQVAEMRGSYGRAKGYYEGTGPGTQTRTSRITRKLGRTTTLLTNLGEAAREQGDYVSTIPYYRWSPGDSSKP